MCKDLSSSQISSALPKPSLNKLDYHLMMASAAGKVSLKPRRPRESFRICRAQEACTRASRTAPQCARVLGTVVEHVCVVVVVVVVVVVGV